MRVTFVLPYAGLQGGLRVIATYADRLKRKGHEVIAVSMPEVIKTRTKIKSLLLGHGLPERQPSYFDGTGVTHRVLETVRSVTDADVPDADVVVAAYNGPGCAPPLAFQRSQGDLHPELRDGGRQAES